MIFYTIKWHEEKHMTSFSFTPVSEDYLRIIDHRFLTMTVSFCHVPSEKARMAAIRFYDFVNIFSQGAFVSSWLLSDKPAKNIPENIRCAKHIPDLLVEMNVKTPTIRTVTDMRKADRKVIYGRDIPIMHWSSDYDAYYYKNVVPYLSSPAEYKQSLLRLFKEPGKKNLMNNLGHDVSGLFFYSPNSLGSNMGQGTIRLTIHAGCISKQSQNAANVLLEEVKALCQLLNNANGTVELTPFPTTSAYSKYFIGDSTLPPDFIQKLPPVPDDCCPRDWYKFCYLETYAWATVISPVTQAQLIHDNSSMESEKSLSIEHLSNSSLCVSLRKPIDQVDVADLAIVKKQLYPAMFPSKREFKINCSPMYRPRTYWELLPIDEDEITIHDGKVIYHHRDYSF